MLAAILTAIKLIDILLIDIVLVISYCTSSCRCSCHSESCANHVPNLSSILDASYSLSSLLPLTRSYSRHVLLAIVLAAGVLITILLIVVMLIALCCFCQLSFVSDTRSNATRVKTALLHVMIAAMGVTLGAFAGNVKSVVAYIDVHTVDIKNRTGLSHDAWNPLCIYKCDPSICCDILCYTGMSQDGTYSGTYQREGRILREVRTRGRYVPVASYFPGGP